MNKLRCARCQELKFGEQLSHSNAHRSVSRNFVYSLCYPQPLYSGCKEELENSRISLFADTVQSRADTLGSLLEAAQVNVGFGPVATFGSSQIRCLPPQFCHFRALRLSGSPPGLGLLLKLVHWPPAYMRVN